VKDAAAQLYERLLILRCQAEDETALAELIAQYSPGLRYFLAKVTGNAASADDLLQDVWFDVYRKINRLEQPAAFAAWIYRIARDKAYREMRRRPVTSAPLDEKLTEGLPADDERFSPEEAEHIRAALGDLPQEQREVLLLRFIEEMSYEQIAEVISRPLGTVRSRIHYAKVALRAKLE
jgi:RNA polymerase sigma-70 factor, ECF subfamily